MTIEYDEKGKYYTEVVTKDPVLSIIQTNTHIIRGIIHVRQDQRLKDALETDEQFIAVTDFNVSGADGSVAYSGSFLAVQKSQIVWIMPLHEKDAE